MRTVTETYNVYTYPELSEEAKEKVNQWYLDDPCRNDEFLEIYTEDFPNKKLLEDAIEYKGCQSYKTRETLFELVMKLR